MTHIALVLPDLAAGGAQRVVLTLAREFVACGHRVDLVVIQGGGAFQEQIPVGVNLVDLRARQTMLGGAGLAFFAIFRLAAWLRQYEPAVVLSTVTGTNLVAILARQLSTGRFKLVIREAVTLKNVRSQTRMQAMRWLYRRADAIVAVSSVVANELSNRIGIPPSRIHSISNPVDVALIQEKAAASVNHPWLMDESKRLIVAVGRLIPQKGYATLIHAFALLPDELHAHLIIVGEGPERVTLGRLIQSLNVGDRAQLVGFDLNPWRWLARADLFVLPSNWEGNPNALLEALALGRPAVVTAYDESIHAFGEDSGIATVPTGDAPAMALAIQQELAKSEVSGVSVQMPEPADVARKYLQVMTSPRPTLRPN